MAAACLRSVASSENNSSPGQSFPLSVLKPRKRVSRSLAAGFQFGEERRRVALGEVERFAPGIDAQHLAGPAVIENL